MKTKKVFSILIISIMLVCTLALTACGSSSISADDLDAKFNDKLAAYKTDLEDSASLKQSNENIFKYLTHWAESKNLEYVTNSSGNIIISVPSSEDYQDADPTVVVCPYDYTQMDNYIPSIAIALYLSKYNENTGDLTIIFTPESNHVLTGFDKVDSKYFADDAVVFCLNGAESGQISNNSGASKTYTLTKSVTTAAPTYTKAYKIRMEGLTSYQVGSTAGGYNPIIQFRNLLAELKSSNIGYQISYITSDGGGMLTPTYCEMVIVIDQDKIQKFTTKMDSKTESFNKDKDEDHPGATYTYEEVSTPATAITKDSSSDFVTFLYTLLNGEYSSDDDGNTISLNNIVSVKTENNAIVVNTAAASLDKSVLTTISADIKTLAGISDASYSEGTTTSLWEADEESEFITSVSKAYKKYTGKELKFSDSIASTTANAVHQKNSKSQIVVMTSNSKVMNTCAGTIVEYLLSSKPSKIFG